ncbi:MAG: methylated-DNA--[protein]-cysteine S-methyltransferase [Christensenellales bacterium]|nr:methylated-DNA--[protein]-cysteine S-methyltransferase [Christensenellales bacterium]
MKQAVWVDTPLGPMGLAEEAGSMTHVFFRGTAAPAAFREGWTPLLREAARQLDEYFAGARRAFALPLAPQGTPFERQVWDALRAIPYGQTLSYGELAACIGRPAAGRAVGRANGRNPLPILVPCHRVIGADGRLTGYAGGLEAKAWLLALERRHGG